MRPISNIERIELYIPHLDFCVDAGYVEATRGLVDAFSRAIEDSGREELIVKFHKASLWLVEAEQFEELHGRGSKINRAHPRIKVLQRSAT